MKIKITKQSIMDAVENTDFEFNTALFKKLFNLMPKDYGEMLVEDIFFDKIYQGKCYWQIKHELFGIRRRFCSFKELEAYCLENKIATRSALKKHYDGYVKTFMTSSGWEIKKLFPDQNKSS